MLLGRRFTFILMLFALAACGSEDGVASEKSARASYLGLDQAIEKALNLGFAGFNAATSANIPPQATEGDVSGTMDVTGQADQGASANKGMRLDVVLTEYQDVLLIVDPDDAEIDFEVVYDTDPDDPLFLDAKFQNYPDGTFTGTLTGTVYMTGDLTGAVTLDLSFSGETEADPSEEIEVRRVAGTTSVTGTATSRYGTYAIDLVI